MLPKLLFLILVVSNSAYSQELGLKWVKSFYTNANTIYNQIATDSADNIYITGYFGGQLNSDPNSPNTIFQSQGDHDVYLIKLDRSGNYLWGKQFGGTQDDSGTSIAISPNGDVILSGMFSDTLDADPGTTSYNLISHGYTDNYIIKLDLNGNFLWAFQTGGINSEDTYGITTDSLNNIYSTGNFSGTLYFQNDSVISQNANDSYVLKLDSSGNLIWLKHFESSSNSNFRTVKIDHSNHVLIGGFFFGTIDFDPDSGISTQTSAGYSDAFILKLTSDGQLVWANYFGNTLYESCLEVIVDHSGNYYMTGTFTNTVDFDPSPGVFSLTSSSYKDCYVAKFDNNGYFLWVHSLGGFYGEEGRSIVEDEFGNTYTIGNFTSVIDVNSGTGINFLTASGVQDVHILKLSETGTLLAAKQIGGANSTTFSNKIIKDSENNLLIAGSFKDSPDFHPGNSVVTLNSPNSISPFIAKLSECTNIDTTIQSVISCKPFLWINGTTYSSSTDSETFTLPGSFGCDSTVILNFTYQPVDNSIYYQNDSLFSNYGGPSYQWYNCNNDSIISSATDQSYFPIANGGYAVIIDNESCIDTSECYMINFLGIPEHKSTITSVFPNPGKGVYHLQGDQIDHLSIVELTNNEGQEIQFHCTLDQQGASIEILDSTPGIYYLKISSVTSSPQFFKLINL